MNWALRLRQEWWVPSHCLQARGVCQWNGGKNSSASGLIWKCGAPTPRELLAEYYAEKGEIDWGSMPLNCISNILFSCGHSQIVQQMLKQIGVEIDLNPLLLTPYRDLEVSGDYLWGLSGAAYDFDDPIDVFGQSYITNGGRWYQRQSVPEIDRLYELQKFESDLEKRKELVWQMDEIAMNESGWIMLQWWDFHHLKWPYVKPESTDGHPMDGVRTLEVGRGSNSTWMVGARIPCRCGVGGGLQALLGVQRTRSQPTVAPPGLSEMAG